MSLWGQADGQSVGGQVVKLPVYARCGKQVHTFS